MAGKISGLAVSIPERVWGGLERTRSGQSELAHRVSIPERVWGGLERGRILSSD